MNIITSNVYSWESKVIHRRFWGEISQIQICGALLMNINHSLRQENDFQYFPASPTISRRMEIVKIIQIWSEIVTQAVEWLSNWTQESIIQTFTSEVKVDKSITTLSLVIQYCLKNYVILRDRDMKIPMVSASISNGKKLWELYIKTSGGLCIRWLYGSRAIWVLGESVVGFE